MGLLRAVWRCMRVLLHVLYGGWIVWRHAPHWNAAQQAQQVEQWSQQLLQCMGIRLQVYGQAPQAGPVLLMSNHISWLDIPVLHAVRHCRFVAKSDIRHWPLVGKLANAAGTLYIERASSRDAMRVVHQMAESLQAGDVLAVFPEGTTGDGRTMLPFHANLLQAAVATHMPVQPVALRFVDMTSGQTSFAPSYIGDETLIGSVWRTLSAKAVMAVVCFGEPQYSEGRNRRQWAQDLQGAVESLWRRG